MKKFILFPYWAFNRFFIDGTPTYEYYPEGFDRWQKASGYFVAIILVCLFLLAGVYF